MNGGQMLDRFRQQTQWYTKLTWPLACL